MVTEPCSDKDKAAGKVRHSITVLEFKGLPIDPNKFCEGNEGYLHLKELFV